MKTLLQILLSIVIAIALVAVGFYLGTQQTLVVQVADQVGLSEWLPASLTVAGTGTASTGAQLFAGQNLNAGALSGGESEGSFPARPAPSDAAPGTDDTSATGDSDSTGTDRTGTDGTGVAGGFTPPNMAAMMSGVQTVAIRAADSDAAAETTGEQIVTLAAAGTIAEVAVSIGDDVDAGDLLLVLDAADLEQAVEEALAALELAQADARGSDADAQRSVEQARAVLDAAAADLAAAQVTAPIVGEVVAVNVEVGQQVERGLEAIVLAGAGSTAAPAASGWLVPTTAIQDRNGNTTVMVVRDGQPRPVSVTTGAVQDEWTVVDSADLQEGDEVIEDVSALFGSFGRGGNFPGGGGFPGGGFPGNSDGATEQQQP